MKLAFYNIVRTTRRNNRNTENKENMKWITKYSTYTWICKKIKRKACRDLKGVGSVLKQCSKEVCCTRAGHVGITTMECNERCVTRNDITNGRYHGCPGERSWCDNHFSQFANVTDTQLRSESIAVQYWTLCAGHTRFSVRNRAWWCSFFIARAGQSKESKRRSFQSLRVYRWLLHLDNIRLLDVRWWKDLLYIK